MKKITIKVNLNNNSYPIIIGKNLLNNTNAIKEKNLASGSNITDKEGLERAYQSPSNTYVIGSTL